MDPNPLLPNASSYQPTASLREQTGESDPTNDLPKPDPDLSPDIVEVPPEPEAPSPTHEEAELPEPDFDLASQVDEEPPDWDAGE